MSAIPQNRPQYATATRVDVTEVPTDRIAERARRNRVRGSEVSIERRGGRTFLVTRPSR